MLRFGGLPGDSAFGADDFKDALRRSGYDGMRDLAAMWLDHKYGHLLAMDPESPGAKVEWARVQGVRQFLRWVEERRVELLRAADGEFLSSP